ncbi:GNAT family N-acetyltransferase [Cognatishimia sp. F0-27]|uniref:GNAT family N-acetyltransferase n=1 Tax=Cognatishimia sp. F0-27 TaxID=2816855 RepID=UPI001D0C8DF3|nr:GNAT family N-acetyltransferase [Cognatishimia sp. F0-27]MCC1494702.1 GNAT family N-acetyltransferase [Cognatishimia sp. F0-27]
MALRFEPVLGDDAGAEALIAAHHALMRAQSPEESCHVLDAAGLRRSGARLFVLRTGAGTVCAIGAFQPLDHVMPIAGAVELKSMHIAASHRGQGLGHALLTGLLDAARAAGATTVWLETGSESGFAAARALYERAGFAYCPPFGTYREDPLSVFMTRNL